MDRSTISKLLQDEMGDYLAEKGFKVLSNCTIVKKTKDMKHVLGIGMKSYDYKYISSFQPFIQIFKIEQPLNRMYYFDKDEKEIKKIISDSDTVFGSSMREHRKYPYQVGESLDFALRSIYDLEELADIIKKYMENTALPFFEKYSNLHNINQEIIDYDITYQEGVGYTEEFYADFPDTKIVCADPLGKFRRMFIMKYCNNSRYDDFSIWYEKALFNAFEDNEKLLNRYTKIFKDIQEYLSKLEIT